MGRSLDSLESDYVSIHKIGNRLLREGFPVFGGAVGFEVSIHKIGNRLLREIGARDMAIAKLKFQSIK